MTKFAINLCVRDKYLYALVILINMVILHVKNMNIDDPISKKQRENLLLLRTSITQNTLQTRMNNICEVNTLIQCTKFN